MNSQSLQARTRSPLFPFFLLFRQNHLVGPLLQLGQFLLFATLLSGCTNLPTPPPVVGRPADGNLSHWRLSGKLGYRSSDESGSAWIDWRQQGEDFEIQLNGPLGTGATRIHGSDQGTTLVQAGREPITATDAETLAAELFGWAFPARQLRYWATGSPAPGIETSQLHTGNAGIVLSLEQANWQLSFDRHAEMDGWLLPGRIVGVSDAGQFTLVIKKWELPQSANPGTGQ